MIQTFEVNAEPRSDTGKGASRRLRRQGLVPGIVYGGHQDPALINLVHSKLLLHLEHEAFYSHILDLKIGEVSEKVVLKDMQRHPAKPFIMHVDFQRVRADEELTMHVPLKFINENSSVGVKMGGLVSHHIADVEITCLPSDLPEVIEVDLKNLDLGGAIHLSELKLPAGVELAHEPDPDLPVVSIHSPHGGTDEEEGKA